MSVGTFAETVEAWQQRGIPAAAKSFDQRDAGDKKILPRRQQILFVDKLRRFAPSRLW